ncbi:hypothetical protein L218DRAFT_384834 [Marasmius fiardii PR-910]|nr:hypothetical protein L218DRAFT_384834 [Marasmius fiardii PR-910]
MRSYLAFIHISFSSGSSCTLYSIGFLLITQVGFMRWRKRCKRLTFPTATSIMKPRSLWSRYIERIHTVRRLYLITRAVQGHDCEDSFVDIIFAREKVYNAMSPICKGIGDDTADKLPVS